MSLNFNIKKLLLLKGASIVKFADLTEIPADDRDNFETGIIIGVALDPHKIINIAKAPSIEYQNEYYRANRLLDELSEKGAQFLISQGYSALAQTREKVRFIGHNRSQLPYKTIATKAGLGWIGKNNLLITKKYGAAIRLSSILTNAKFKTGKALTKSECNECDKCVKICPANALKGNLWNTEIDRDELVDVFICDEKIEERGKEINSRHGSCGLCMFICPWTQKYIKRNKLM